MELYLSWIQRYIWGKKAQTSISKPFRIISEFIHSSIHSRAFYKLLNLPRQGFPATCPTGHCCVCSPLIFASEILCDSPTYNKQRMNKKSLAVLPGNPKCTMTSCWMVDLFIGLLLGNCGYQTIESRLSTKMYNDLKAPQWICITMSCGAWHWDWGWDCILLPWGVGKRSFLCAGFTDPPKPSGWYRKYIENRTIEEMSANQKILTSL